MNLQILIITNYSQIISPIKERMFNKCLKHVKKVVSKCDLFCTKELIRYKQEPEFKSATGGICSIAMILAFGIIFTQTIISTVNKQTINAQTTLYEDIQPSLFTAYTDDFLFALGINGLNLSDPVNKYFNVNLYQKIQKANQSKISNTISLTPCDRSIWTETNPEFGAPFDKLKLSQFLCSPPGTTFEFQGKFSSDTFKYLKISVSRCVSSGNQTCVNDTVIDNLISSNGGSLTFSYYFVNTIINSQDSDYLGNYLEDRNYFTFTKAQGSSSNIFISAYQIQNDESLLPVQNLHYDNGGVVYQSTQSFIYSILNNSTEYVQLFLRKSSLSLSIQRSYKKYDDTLSYIGGLFSSIIAAIFIMSKYNQSAYEIELASKVYRNEEKKIDDSAFNLLSYFALIFYSILNFFGKSPDWQKYKELNDCQEQVGKQLDIKFILKKLMFLQDCMNYLFQDFEIQCLHLKGKMSLNKAGNLRKCHSSYSRAIKLFRKYSKKMDETDKSPEEATKSKKQLLEMQIVHVSNRTRNQEEPHVQIQSNIPFNHSKCVPQQSTEEIQMDNSSIESADDDSDVQFYNKVIENLKNLQQKVNEGNTRCNKIYKSLSGKVIQLIDKKSLALEIQSKNNFLNQTETFLNQQFQGVPDLLKSSKVSAKKDMPDFD